jgi:hypothetical protein
VVEIAAPDDGAKATLTPIRKALLEASRLRAFAVSEILISYDPAFATVFFARWTLAPETVMAPLPDVRTFSRNVGPYAVAGLVTLIVLTGLGGWPAMFPGP